MAEEGWIPEGSMLVVESPERLSRIGVTKGRALFDRITACKIDIALVRFGTIIRHNDENDFTSALIVAIGLYLGHLAFGLSPQTNSTPESINAARNGTTKATQFTNT